MDKGQVQGAVREIKGSLEAAAGKLIGDAKLQMEGKMDKAVGAAYRAFGGVKPVGRKGTSSKSAGYKTASGLKY
jgi:uncharacterized protein YjbJ (UPF0337 family)